MAGRIAGFAAYSNQTLQLYSVRNKKASKQISTLSVVQGRLVNIRTLWRTFRRQSAIRARAERRLLRYFDECEA
jgi:hypothetical protein